MKIGLLWQVEKKKSLVESVHDAMKFYTDKYGEHPDVAYVNPKDLDGTEKSCLIPVKTQKVIIRGHIWIGLENNDALVLRPKVTQ